MTKSNPDFLLIVAVYDATDQRTNMDVSDYLASNIQDPLSRVTGVGDVNVFGAPHAMRIWLNPSGSPHFQLMPSDVVSALQAQNTEVAAGEVGGLPQADSQMLNATVTAQGKLQTPEQFAQIILKTDPERRDRAPWRRRAGRTRRRKLQLDQRASTAIPARASRSRSRRARTRSRPPSSSRQRVQELSANLSRRHPIRLCLRHDRISSSYRSMKSSKTLFEAIVLVVLVMFVFLQNWRATAGPGDRHSGRAARDVRACSTSPASPSTR